MQNNLVRYLSIFTVTISKTQIIPNSDNRLTQEPAQKDMKHSWSPIRRDYLSQVNVQIVLEFRINFFKKKNKERGK